MDLKGAKVLVTRPRHQADNLCRLLAGQGGHPVRLPTLAIAAVADAGKILEVLATLDKYQWLVFVSANAVHYAVQANGGNISHRLTAIAAIGQATAAAIRQAGMVVDLLPLPPFNSEALLAAPPMHRVEGSRILIVRGEGGREQLAETLVRRGALVGYLEVYRRCLPQVDCSAVRALLSVGQLAAVTVTSGEALENLLAMMGEEYRPQLLAVPLVVIAERLRPMAAGFGFKQIAVSRQATDAAMVAAVVNTLTGETR